jgi:hypothetical protein
MLSVPTQYLLPVDALFKVYVAPHLARAIAAAAARPTTVRQRGVGSSRGSGGIAGAALVAALPVLWRNMAGGLREAALALGLLKV